MQGFDANGQSLPVVRPALEAILHEDTIRRDRAQPRHDADRLRHPVRRRGFLGQRTYHEAGTVLEIPILPDHLQVTDQRRGTHRIISNTRRPTYRLYQFYQLLLFYQLNHIIYIR